MGLLIFYGVISIFFSFLCSILEAVLLSVTPTFVNVSKSENKSFAAGLEALKSDVDKPLIAILTINTIAHTVGAILVGEQAGKLYADSGLDISIFGFEFTASAVGIVSAIMTMLVLVVSEIIPKTIGATYWKKLAGFATSTLNIMVTVLKYTGLLWIMQRITSLFGSSEHHSVFSRADFSAMATVAEETGEIAGDESQVIKNLMKLRTLNIESIMTPRHVMVSANQDTHIDNFYRSNKDLRFSRIPVYEQSPDHISGYILKDEVLQSMIEGMGDQPLKSLLRPIVIVPPTASLGELLSKFTENNEHIATVSDQYGSLVGLVTMEDMVETLLGTEIMDEFDTVEDMQKFARQKWEERAKARGLMQS